MRVLLWVQVFASAAEALITRDEALWIFAMTRTEWEAHASRIGHAQSAMRPYRLGSGIALTPLDASRGVGLTIRPMFEKGGLFHASIVVGRKHAGGSPVDLDAIENTVVADTARDLGALFILKSRRATFSEALRDVELWIQRARCTARAVPRGLPFMRADH